MGQQGGDQFLLADAAGLGFKQQAHGLFFARLVTHQIQHRQHRRLELCLLLRQCLLARLDFGVGDFFDFFQHALGADAWRQLGHHQLPLTARQLFNLPACANLQRTTAGAIGIGNVAGRADDLATTGVVRAGYQTKQFIICQLGRFDQRHTGIRNFTQVVARDFSGQAHGNTAGAIEQREWQPGR